MTVAEEQFPLVPDPRPTPTAAVAAQPVPAATDFVAAEAPVRLLDNQLPSLLTESTGTRWIWIGMILIVAGLYAGTLYRLWTPADGGVDQNAYLTSGRLIAQHFTTQYDPPTPFAYIGGMWDRALPKGDHGGSFYPKYGFGLPLLFAICIWTLGLSKGVIAAFAISPAATVIAVIGTFFLARLMAGSFAAICCSILLACSQVTLSLANNPNSHASCLAFIVWGMYWLVRWWQTPTVTKAFWFRGILAGFLLGYAGLIRYSECLLILPIVVAAAFRLRWSDWRSYLRCATPALAWALPIATLFIYNRITLGEWTGYDSNNESEFGSAFTWAKFQATWEETLRTLHDMGLFFTLPLGVAGLAMLFRRSWKLGLLMLAWVVPGICLYTSYYWSPDRGVAFARFFLTFFPGLCVGAAVCFNDGILGGKEAGEHPLLSIPLDMAVGLVVCVAAGVGAYRSISGLEGGQSSAQSDLFDQQRQRENLFATGNHLLENVPAHSVLFAEEGGFGESPINYLQFIQNWDLYSMATFTPLGGRRGIRFGGGGGGPPAGGQGGGPNGGMNGGPPGGQGGFGSGGQGGFAGGRGRGFGGGGQGGGFGGGGGGFGGGGPGGGFGGGNANATDQQQTPTPMQPRLREYFADLYKSKSNIDLIVEEKNVIDTAFAAGQRVFVAASEAEISSFESTLKTKTPATQHATTVPSKGYTFKEIAHWKDQEAPPEDTTAAAGAGRFGGNFGRRGGGFGGGRGATIAWKLIEIKPTS